MNALDIRVTDVPFDQLADHIARVKEHLRTTTEPNAVSKTGATSVSVAAGYCNTEEGIQILKSLLDKGGNPNLPDSLHNFMKFMTFAERLLPLKYMIEAGLELNHVYAPTPT